MQSEAPLTLILSPLRAGRGEPECTGLGSLFGDPDAVPPEVSLSLSKKERVRVRVQPYGYGLARVPMHHLFSGLFATWPAKLRHGFASFRFSFSNFGLMTTAQ